MGECWKASFYARFALAVSYQTSLNTSVYELGGPFASSCIFVSTLTVVPLFFVLAASPSLYSLFLLYFCSTASLNHPSRSSERRFLQVWARPHLAKKAKRRPVQLTPSCTRAYLLCDQHTWTPASRIQNFRQ